MKPLEYMLFCTCNSGGAIPKFSYIWCHIMFFFVENLCDIMVGATLLVHTKVEILQELSLLYQVGGTDIGLCTR